MLVNRQLPPWNCKFRQLSPDINKISITPWNCTTLINLPPPSNSSVSQHDVLQISPWSFALMCKMPPNLKIYIFFFFLSLTTKIIFSALLNPFRPATKEEVKNNPWLWSYGVKLKLRLEFLLQNWSWKFYYKYYTKK